MSTNVAPILARISDYPFHWAHATPHAEAIVDADRVLDYAAFSRSVDHAACALLAAGVGRGDRVATLATASAEHLIMFMATTRIGGVWLGLNPKFQQDELGFVLSDSAPKVVTAMLDIEGRHYGGDFSALRRSGALRAPLIALSGHTPGAISWPDFLGAGRDIAGATLDQAASAVSTKDPALIVYTSGSTGRPKGALLSHESIVSTVRIQCATWRAAPVRILNNAPINHIGGAVQIGCHAIVAGGANVLMPRFDPVAMPAFIREQRITVLHQVATMYQMLIEKGRPTKADLASLQALVWSGAPAPRVLVEHLRGFCPNLYTSYGLTEAGGEVLYTRAGASDEELASTVGFPPAEIGLRLGSLDGEGEAAAPNGEIQVKGPTIMSGYFEQPQATQAAFTSDGWVRTGDIAERDANGAYRITGRMREMFKSGGYNVYPREIEIVLERHPAVSMAAVVSTPDALYGEIGHAWVLSCDPNLTPAELVAHCRSHLANYKVPKSMSIRAELPLLAIHKLDKVTLRDWSMKSARSEAIGGK